jgi:predicted alpha/beta superfamily hydrolase
MKKATIALLAGLGAGHAPAHAAEISGWAPVVLPQTEQRDIHSRHTGHDFRIFISKPQQPPPSNGYPVIYVLDGNALFPMLALQANAREMRPDSASRNSVVVVGVGFPGDDFLYLDKRTMDYTPPPPAADAPADTGQPHGGADRFLAFMQTELKPLVEARYRIDRHRQTLFGHSYGGLFTLYTLINQPDAFQNYLAASPSIWWNDRQLLRQSNRLLASAAALKPTHLWLTVGGAEEPATDTTPASEHERRRAERRMRSNSQALFERLEPLDRHGLTRTLTIHPNADHGENSTLTAAGAIEFVLQPDAPR